ncbi:MAG: 50S ribosomal protein L6 [Verrucomicrobiota bacterium]
MSRIGNKLISVPDKVKVTVNGPEVLVEGPKGKLQHRIPTPITAKVENKTVLVQNGSTERSAKALHGLTRSLINNMVEGVNTGFIKKLEIHGVGFKSNVQGKILNLSLGKSHPINYEIPEGIKVTVTDNTQLAVEGVDKQLVGAVAADIRRYYPPEPYKGKGVRYSGEQIRRKAGKTAQSK